MIFIIDFGSQTTHLIGRRLRNLGVNIKIISPESALEEIKRNKPSGIILSGGPASVYEKNAPTIDRRIYTLDIPILGICYGWQLTAQLLEGQVVATQKEYGPTILKLTKTHALTAGFSNNSQVWMSHGDSVVKNPPGFFTLGHTSHIKSAIVTHIKKQIYGVQFHPEIEHTKHGVILLKNFASLICGLPIKNHQIDIVKMISDIKSIVGTAEVVAGVSGGVDSTVAATLIAKAIGHRLHPIYIESGLMRTNTKQEVIALFEQLLNIKPVVVEAQSIFLSNLKNITNPEKKRKIIGKLYIDLFNSEAKKIKNAKFLAQGTIYSDVIESKGTDNSDKIKSHHNVGGLPKKMKYKLLEPLRSFYKDEVREIGRMLKLPDYVINKQVFPGSGQAIRIIGALTQKRLDQQQIADQIVLDEIIKAGFYNQLFMCFPIMTNVKSTAVKGDGRSYLEVVALRIIESKDVMSSSWARLPYDLLQTISSRIVNEVPGVSRVVYDITTKPPATMEWE